jgi:PAS domain S-box-containing protein
MQEKPPSSAKPAQLRSRAEAHLRDQKKLKAGVAKTGADSRRLLHELQVHQIELEMQNAELQVARDWAEALLENYTDLYDFAPVGYFTLTAAGAILQANLTGATLVGIERSRLVGQSFGRLVSDEFRPAFSTFLEQVFTGEARQSGDFELACKGQPLRFVNIEAQGLLNGQQCRAVVVDITARKVADAALRRNEVLFSALIEQAPVGVYVVDAQLCLCQVNPRALPVFKNVHPLIGRDFSEIIQIIWSPRIAYQILARFRHTLKTGESYQSPEFSEQRQDTGLKEFYEWQLQRVTLPAGEYGVVCFFNNITERMQAEAARVRLEVMTASNRKLEQEIIRRKTLERALKTSEQQLRQLSHEILLTQEAERKRISRELHDTVLQTLVGINVHLASLTPKLADNPANLRRKIAQTQLLVEKSLAMVHRFAVELRPTVLDDLGLIPALHTFMKDFMKRTGVRASLTAYAAVNQLPIGQSAVLYRVTLEALNNVAIHAQASAVEVEIKKLPDWICLTITDDGKSFDVKSVLRTKGNGRLGLLGMRERLEMVGGKFSIKSTPGHGTTVSTRIPVTAKGAEKNRKRSLETKS